MFFFSKFYVQIIIILQFILINYKLSEKDLNDSIYDTFDFIYDEVIETIRMHSNNYVYNFNIQDDVKDILLRYNQTIILHNKNLIKVNESTFIYLKLEEDFLYIGTYKQNRDRLDIDSFEEHFYIDLNDIKYLEGKLISEKKILLTGIVQNNFEIIIMDLNSNELKISIIPELFTIETMEIKLYQKNKIQCESVDGNNFFCILNFLNNNDSNLFFIEVNLDNMENINSKIICKDNCISANIIRVNNIENKYLICYQNIEGLYLYTICQYYTLINDGIVVSDSHIISKINYENRINNTLILSLYQNTAFIQFDAQLNRTVSSILIVSSLDFKINIKSILKTGYSPPTICLINDDNNIYHFYEEKIKIYSATSFQDFNAHYKEETTEFTTYPSESHHGHYFQSRVNEIYTLIMGNIKLKECLNIDSLIISNEKKEVDFATDHINDTIFFSFDKNIQLYKDKEIINLELKNNIKIEKHIFRIRKIRKEWSFSKFLFLCLR